MKNQLIFRQRFHHIDTATFNGRIARSYLILTCIPAQLRFMIICTSQLLTIAEHDGPVSRQAYRYVLSKASLRRSQGNGS